jgi:hypothetical protein
MPVLGLLLLARGTANGQSRNAGTAEFETLQPLISYVLSSDCVAFSTVCLEPPLRRPLG